MYMIQFNRRCSGVNFTRWPETLYLIPINLAWHLMVGTIQEYDFTNFGNVKFVRSLNWVGFGANLENKSITHKLGLTKS